MYLIHTQKKLSTTHILRDEDAGKLLEDVKQHGDALCQILSSIRNQTKVGKRWTIQTTASGKMCKNCLILEDKKFDALLKKKRESWLPPTPSSLGTGVK